MYIHTIECELATNYWAQLFFRKGLKKMADQLWNLILSQTTAIHKTLETKFQFLYETTHYGKSSISIFQQSFYNIDKKKLFWKEDWVLGYNSMKFKDFLDFSYFPKIVSRKSFGNLWGTSYVPCLLVIITLLFTCVEKNICLSIKILWT